MRLLYFLLIPALFAQTKLPITSDTLFDWRTATEPQISQDGKSVVYVLGWADRMKDVFYSNLWTVPVSGADPRPLTQGNFKDSSPRWSPDGTRLAYLSNRSGKTQIHVRWIDGGQDAKITDLEEAPASIAWSPDGKWISFSKRVAAKPAWSVKMPDKPAGATWAAPPIVVTRLRWRNDGTGIIPPGYLHIFVVPSAGGTPRQVTSGDFDYVDGRARDTAPQWTPDGDWILTSCQREVDPDYNLEGADIWAIRVKDGLAKQLTQRKGPDGSPVASPDGKKIAYTGYDFKLQSYTVTRLYVMDADGSNSKELAAGLDRDVTQIRWAADSSGVYFVSEDRGTSHVHLATLAGGHRQITSGDARYSTGYAAGDAFSISAQGRIAISRATSKEPADLVTFTVDRPAVVTRLTTVNDSLMAGRSLGEVEPISYDSFDGKPMQGWIIKPPNFDASRKYPLLLDIHGGPHAMYGVEFNHQFQTYAGRGFVVLYTNPRGSTGYGEDFGNIIHTRYPGDDYKDLMAGVDVMIAKGYIDPKRLGVTGGSGGGLLTAWIIGHTDRFAAAVSQYPVTNWITQVGTADGGYTHAAVWMKGMPWDNAKAYMEHSPIFYANNFKTPTMVITGEQDLRTPMAESEELYFALKAKHVDSVLVRIPDEPHGIRGASPSHRIAKVEHILGWLEQHTKATVSARQADE